MALGRSVEVVQKEIEDRFLELAAMSPAELTEGEVLEFAERSQRIRSMADAQCARAAGALESSKAWVVEGARSVTGWLGWRCRITKARASAAVVTWRLMRAMPRAEVALLQGRITTDHVRVLAVAQEVAPEAFADDGEERLVRLAETLRFSEWVKVVRYWRQLAAPDGEEERATRRWRERRLHCSRSFDGTVVLDALLDPVSGEIILRELERIERELFEEDLAEARERLGPNAPLSELRRTPAQRRADALRIMAERSAAKPPGAVEPRVLIHVLAGHESVNRVCELSNGQVVTPGEVCPLLNRADVERVVFESPSKVIDIGVRRRLFTGATRQAVELRDRQCVHDSCDVPAEQCEVDHIVPYAEGGLTVQDNGRCKCKYHHRRSRPPPDG